ncbi:Telomere zinc finger-associated protein [Gracilariopsis chorda]|uniref:Telomere zinc finger-associated protein n=1 Tax=Gracilariopsis chorda TaxID=448386 RepID=A0A2V3J387_9FLOR|nr:Telomere zinc finger-associated protein [Gracilariopsis chorda]|eukprot:PXF47850.1 Telomere zinc finger-associated protein [Gracilariopsis chorda]
MSSQTKSQGSSNPRGSSANSTERKKRSRDSVNQILLNLDADCSGIPASVEAARAHQIVHPSLLRFPGEASERSQPPTGMTPSGGAGAAGPSRARRTQHSCPSVAGPSTVGWPQQQRASSNIGGPSTAGWPKEQRASSSFGGPFTPGQPPQQSTSSSLAGPSTAGWSQRGSSNIAGPSTATRSQQQRASSNVAVPSMPGAVEPESKAGMSSSGTEAGERERKKRRFDECLKCLRKFNSQAEAKRHQKTCPTSYNCTVCNYSTPYKKLIERHQAKHADTRCSICDRTFASREALAAHHVDHHGSKMPMFACRHCGRQYERKISLQSHIRCNHPHSGQVGCPHCFLSFFNQRGLDVHISKKHPTPKLEKYACEICGREYSSKGAMMEHVRHSHGGTS